MRKSTFLWSSSLWLIVWNLVHSCQFSVIIFLHSLCIGLILKCSVSWLSCLVHVLCLHLWFVWFLRSSLVYLKKEQSTIAGWRLTIRRAPADHDIQACCLGPTLCHILIQHFYHALYQTLGVVYYLFFSKRVNKKLFSFCFLFLFLNLDIPSRIFLKF